MFLKIGNKGNRKTNFIFRNFKDQEKWKKYGGQKRKKKTNIRKKI
jgi:hypothetical protein